VIKNLEARTTGSTFDRPDKRTDGLLLTRAEVSQYVLVEIKKSSTDLLQKHIQARMLEHIGRGLPAP
jgi:hypothetical protein